MQTVLELIAAVVVWMAVATLNHLGVQVEIPRAEPKAERVIQRESSKPAETARTSDCPDKAKPPTDRIRDHA